MSCPRGLRWCYSSRSQRSLRPRKPSWSSSTSSQAQLRIAALLKLSVCNFTAATSKRQREPSSPEGTGRNWRGEWVPDCKCRNGTVQEKLPAKINNNKIKWKSSREEQQSMEGMWGCPSWGPWPSSRSSTCRGRQELLLHFGPGEY